MKIKIINMLKRMRRPFIVKFLLSGILAFIAINLILSLNNPFYAFFILTFVHYIAIDVVYEYVLISGRGLFHEISTYLHQLQDMINGNNNVDIEKKKLLNIKILAVKDIFLKGVITLRFLNSNFYDNETEMNNIKSYAEKTVTHYTQIWEEAGITKPLIERFSLIHAPAIERFLQEIEVLIMSSKSIHVRREYFAIKLKKLVNSSIYEMIEIEKEGKV